MPCDFPKVTAKDFAVVYVENNIFQAEICPAKSSHSRSFREWQDFQEFSGFWTVFRWSNYMVLTLVMTNHVLLHYW